jgi:hypothetical protein
MTDPQGRTGIGPGVPEPSVTGVLTRLIRFAKAVSRMPIFGVAANPAAAPRPRERRIQRRPCTSARRGTRLCGAGLPDDERIEPRVREPREPENRTRGEGTVRDGRSAHRGAAGRAGRDLSGRRGAANATRGRTAFAPCSARRVMCWTSLQRPARLEDRSRERRAATGPAQATGHTSPRPSGSPRRRTGDRTRVPREVNSGRATSTPDSDRTCPVAASGAHARGDRPAHRHGRERSTRSGSHLPRPAASNAEDRRDRPRPHACTKTTDVSPEHP